VHGQAFAKGIERIFGALVGAAGKAATTRPGPDGKADGGDRPQSQRKRQKRGQGQGHGNLRV
jgi:hypothetical protein